LALPYATVSSRSSCRVHSLRQYHARACAVVLGSRTTLSLASQTPVNRFTRVWFARLDQIFIRLISTVDRKRKRLNCNFCTRNYGRYKGVVQLHNAHSVCTVYVPKLLRYQICSYKSRKAVVSSWVQQVVFKDQTLFAPYCKHSRNDEKSSVSSVSPHPLPLCTAREAELCRLRQEVQLAS